MEQSHRDARARASDRVAEGDGATIDVELFAIKMQLAIAGQDLGGEGLIQFDEIEVRQVETVPLFHLANGRHRPNAHDPRINSRRGYGKNSPERLKIILLSELLAPP